MLAVQLAISKNRKNIFNTSSDVHAKNESYIL